MSDSVLFEKYGLSYKPGSVIFSEGDTGDKMYIIQSGRVGISKTIERRQHQLAELIKGDFFGEMAIVTRQKRTATATALDEVGLLAFDRQGFESMIEKNAKIAMNIIDKLCKRLQHSNGLVQDLVRRNVRASIALGLYYRFNEKPEDEQYLSLDQVTKDIAGNLDVDDATVGEALSQLAEGGVVTVNGNAIRLKDKRKLAALAERMGG